ncbi:AlbA family DNA-binding domain-containing protein [Allorhizocola rhizosphaerae]|uniref:AlbA family DNA-binding domain-containing protein n=1 Tax=Allorhizocola rhizosphaerae TaxID=1872709 RepID=UPI001FE41BA3|nr:RNA-binding domain-containing protein [Allorhizocola rhizosphaerae]
MVGVEDDGEIVGVPATDRAAVQLLIASAVRDNIEPAPRYQLRWVEHDHKHVLLLEVERPASVARALPEEARVLRASRG